MVASTRVAGLSLQDIREAHARIRDKINRTPVMTSSTLDEQAGGALFFKCENFQKIGAFKARGATNAIFALSDEEARGGVVTHSSGNHAAAVARAAKLRGIPAYIVMPHNVPKAKQESVRRYGAKVELCEPNLKAREAGASRIMSETGAKLVHPFNDWRVMAGQGTATLELLEERPEIDLVLCPIGGGGLLSGTVTAAKGMKPGIRVVGVEPAGADDAYRSFKSGAIVPMTNPQTIADGLRGSLGDKTFDIISHQVDDVVTVSEAAICRAMRTIWEVLKIIVEPSAAVPYAAIVERKIDVTGKRVGLIVTGGNLDLDSLPWMSNEVL
ncbi:MAG TPA: pyridoxal-phosphate dependent enzyme [Steroidobacteraceae bacterium]|jgi:threonine dehydratase|nr:pyridoxal-phosphate dependent enzyme [Steroidobacteraceae bacterium]